MLVTGLVGTEILSGIRWDVLWGGWISTGRLCVLKRAVAKLAEQELRNNRYRGCKASQILLFFFCWRRNKLSVGAEICRKLHFCYRQLFRLADELRLPFGSTELILIPFQADADHLPIPIVARFKWSWFYALHRAFGIKSCRFYLSVVHRYWHESCPTVWKPKNGIPVPEPRAYKLAPDFQNCIPQCDSFLENNYTKEEMKLVNETRKILGDHTPE